MGYASHPEWDVGHQLKLEIC